MLNISQQKEVLSVENIEQFPCEDLLIIDELWRKCSDNKFGFSIQNKLFEKGIWQSETDRNEINLWFAKQVKWYLEEENRWLRINEIIDKSDNSPIGHFPWRVVCDIEFIPLKMLKLDGEFIINLEKRIFSNHKKYKSLFDKLKKCKSINN